MSAISSGQIKAARSILDWSQDDLARATGLSISTIRNLEAGNMSPRGKTYEAIRAAIECAGVEFIEPEGVRRRLDEVCVFQGEGACAALFSDMLVTLRRTGGNASLIAPNQALLVETCGCGSEDNLEMMERLSDVASIRCLLFEEQDPIEDIRGFVFRSISKRFLSPLPTMTYGDKHALVLPAGGVLPYRFVVIQSRVLSAAQTQYFDNLWNLSSPLALSEVEENRISTVRLS